MINNDRLILLSNKCKDETQTYTEESIKNGLIMPFFSALGYDLFNEREFTPSLGGYTINLNDTKLISVYIKSYKSKLDISDISSISETSKLIIVTNGDEYWIIPREDTNVITKIKLSELTPESISNLRIFSRNNIENLNISYIEYTQLCEKLVYGLEENIDNIGFIGWLAEQSNTNTNNTSELIHILKSKLYGKNNSQSQILSTRKQSKELRSSIKLNHEYIYNDFSDGDWKHHKLLYAIVFGVKLENNPSYGDVLAAAIEGACQILPEAKDKLLTCGQFTLYNNMKISEIKSKRLRNPKYLSSCGLWIDTAYSGVQIVQIISSIFKLLGIEDENIILNFRD